MPTPRKRIKVETDSIPKSTESDIETPPHWLEMYNRIEEMRKKYPAPVDTVGCEKVPKNLDPKIRRFQALISLMLSSQTKDTTNALVMSRLRNDLPGGCCLQSLREITVDKLDELIYPVGFHSRKAVYIKNTCERLATDFDGDVPKAIDEMMELPGVGPKMAYLLQSAAWGKNDGIGVDVHVHRLTNMWGWVHTKTPEETREALQRWLPREYWKGINPLLVGFGQTICPSRGKKCKLCTLTEFCPAAQI